VSPTVVWFEEIVSLIDAADAGGAVLLDTVSLEAASVLSVAGAIKFAGETSVPCGCCTASAVIEPGAAPCDVAPESETDISLGCPRKLLLVVAAAIGSAASFGKLALKADPASIPPASASGRDTPASPLGAGPEAFWLDAPRGISGMPVGFVSRTEESAVGPLGVADGEGTGASAAAASKNGEYARLGTPALA
jgi:hypothetical protein